MTSQGFLPRARVAATDVAEVALGRGHRADPVLPGTGGPGGNARLTAWTGLVLLVLFLAELVTLLSVRGLITWHIAIGVLLIPPALLKTASTGWRMVRYYTGNRGYRSAGPPPMLLRWLGPLVVLSSLVLLGSGVLLILAGPGGSRSPMPFLPVAPLTAHKASFVVWAVVTGLHTLARLFPALRLTVARTADRIAVPGRAWRGTALVAALLVAAVGAGVALGASTAWRTDFPREHHGAYHRSH
jgi:hypothetical protein